MIIERDGNKYELTLNEMIEAYNEYHMKLLEYDCRDAISDYAKYYGDEEAFKKYIEEHEAEYDGLIAECVSECDYMEGMYGNNLEASTIEQICMDYIFDNNEELKLILGLDD